jgi:hypothetical protein
MLMDSMLKPKWLLPVLLIGLAILVINLPAPTSAPVLADGPMTVDELSAQAESIQPAADLPPIESLIGEPVANSEETSDQVAQLDTSARGTY